MAGEIVQWVEILPCTRPTRVWSLAAQNLPGEIPEPRTRNNLWALLGCCLKTNQTNQNKKQQQRGIRLSQAQNSKFKTLTWFYWNWKHFNFLVSMTSWFIWFYAWNNYTVKTPHLTFAFLVLFVFVFYSEYAKILNCSVLPIILHHS